MLSAVNGIFLQIFIRHKVTERQTLTERHKTIEKGKS